jgi:hypothetical protein
MSAERQNSKALLRPDNLSARATLPGHHDRAPGRPKSSASAGDVTVRGLSGAEISPQPCPR